MMSGFRLENCLGPEPARAAWAARLPERRDGPVEARGPVSPEQQGCCAGGPGRGRVELDLLRNHLDVAARALLSANTTAFAVGVIELVVLAWA